MQKSILLTGAAGFIGSHLAEKFLEAGHQVLGVDSFLTGREKNLSGIIHHGSFRFEKADVIKRFDFSSPFGKKFDWIFHFACPASPVDFESLAQEILEVDSIGTLNALEFARSQGASFFLASTSEVYGDPLVHPQTESYWGNVNTIGPRSCYDEAKRFSEAAVTVYQKKYDLKARIVRIFNTYGPRMRLDDGRVVPQLCRQALEGKPLTVHGDGSQTRSFCFVSDLVEGIFQMMDRGDGFPMNLGNPREFSLNEFATMVEKIVQKKLGVHYLPGRTDDPKKRCPDISRARKLLAWEPKIALEQGLKITLESFRHEI